jgi:ribonuclease HI
MHLKTRYKSCQLSQAHSQMSHSFYMSRNAYGSQWSPGTIKRNIKERRKLSQQVPIYFISEALTSSKKYYSKMEKICYVVVMSTRKLRHYFKAHKISVLMNQPLNDIFRNQDSSGKIRKWDMELSEHVIDFEKRSAIKSQVLADWTEPSSYTEGIVVDTTWQVHCDGAWRVSGVGVAAILTSPSGVNLRYAARLQFTIETDKCSNNIAEYEVLLLGLRELRAMGVQHCILKTDSKVIAGQIEKEFMARDETLERCLADVRRMENVFKGFTVQHIERTKNTKAYELAKAAAKKAVLPPAVFSKLSKTPL